MRAMQRGDRVLFQYDEPALDLWEGAEATITSLEGDDDIVIRLDDGRVFTTEPDNVRAKETPHDVTVQDGPST